MNSSAIAPNVTTLCSSSLSGNILTLHKTKQEQPDQFVAALANEIRSPLNNINTAVQMLHSEIKDDYLKAHLDIILQSSIQINNLINDTLEYQLTDEVQAKNSSIQQLLDKVIEVAKERITLKNITLKKDYAANDCTIKITLNKTAQ